MPDHRSFPETFTDKLKVLRSQLRLANPLVRYPLNNGEGYQPFFIIGSGRCGTTLLRRILFSHPEICIPPETYFLHKCITKFQRYNRLPWNDLVQLTLATLEYHPKFDSFDLSLRPLANELADTPEGARSLAYILNLFYHYYAESKGFSCSLWGDKTPKNTYHLEKIHRVFPRARYIHLLRNGIDVVHSYLRTGLRSDLPHAARRWQEAVLKARAFGKKHPDRFLEIRYESFVEQPQKTIGRVAAFLEVDFDPAFIEKSRSRTPEMGDVPQHEHFSSVDKPISTRAVGRGKRELDPAQLAEIREIIGSTLTEMGYD